MTEVTTQVEEQGQEAQPVDEAQGQEVGSQEQESQAVDLQQLNDDLKLILNAYAPDGFDLETELGRITRAGAYEPIKVRQPRAKTTAKRAARTSSAAQQEVDYLQMFKDNAAKSGMIGTTPGNWGQEASH